MWRRFSPPMRISWPTPCPRWSACRPSSRRRSSPPGRFPIAAQQELCRDLAQRLGLDFDHARLDQSAHPFSGGTPTDVRITTRYVEEDFASAILAVVHETGHALYERGLPAAYARLPVGEAAGMAVHESQSLIVEMQAFRSDAFLGWLGGQLHETFGGAPEPYRLRKPRPPVAPCAAQLHPGRCRRNDLSGACHPALSPGTGDDRRGPCGCRPSWRLERRPAALLGITPPDDAQGCLQDIHWYDGAFGYFPSYTLGAMAAAQLMQAAREQVAGLDEAFGAAICRRCWHGCGLMCMASAAGSTSIRFWSRQPAAGWIRWRSSPICGSGI